MNAQAAIGLGFSSTADAEAITRVVRMAAERAGANAAALHTSARKRNSENLRQAAQSLGLDLVFHDDTALRQRDAEVVSRSSLVERLVGVGSLAEAAALVGAGLGARLIVCKFNLDGVSCAVALPPEDRI